MLISVLKSKIYRAILTDASIEYPGSFGIDKKIMEETGILPYEKLLIINVNTGSRLETYCITEDYGSGKFSLYGGAARLGAKGDPVIILSFAQMTIEEAKDFKPQVLNLN